MFKFFVFLFIVLIMIMGIVGAAFALGLGDFVAVADGNSNVINNPAGLAELQGKSLNLEHRLMDRDVANLLFWYDDLLVYNAPGQPGYGALFLVYNQDQTGDFVYQHVINCGYGYGWSAFQNISLGISGRYVNFSIDSTFTGSLYTENGLLFDFGILVKLFERCQLGISVKNGLRTQALSHFGLKTITGISYQISGQVISAEIDDLLNQQGQLIYRVGGRLTLFSNWKVHIVLENGVVNHQGMLYGLEYLATKHLELGLWQYFVQSEEARANVFQAAVGYRF